MAQQGTKDSAAISNGLFTTVPKVDGVYRVTKDFFCLVFLALKMASKLEICRIQFFIIILLWVCLADYTVPSTAVDVSPPLSTLTAFTLVSNRTMLIGQIGLF